MNWATMAFFQSSGVYPLKTSGGTSSRSICLCEGGREGGRERGREGAREGGREGGRERREREREGGIRLKAASVTSSTHGMYGNRCLLSPNLTLYM